MGAHLIDGEFQSDKYPTTPRGKVPLSVRDSTAQDLLWRYAQRRRLVDAEFSDDLEFALRSAGYSPSLPVSVFRWIPFELVLLLSALCFAIAIFGYLVLVRDPVMGYLALSFGATTAAGAWVTAVDWRARRGR